MSALDLYGATPAPPPGDTGGSALDLYRAPKRQRGNAKRSSALDLYNTSAPTAAHEDGLLPKVADLAGTIADRTGVSRAMDLLSRPGKAGAALFAGDDVGQIAHAFTSGDAEQYAADIDRVKQHLGLKHGGVEERLGAPVFDTDKLPPIARGLIDFGIATAVDPTTVAGGGMMRGAGALAKGGLGITARIAPKAATRFARDVAGAVGDRMTFGGSAKRELGDERYHAALAADNRQAAKEAEAARRLNARFDQHIAPLAAEDKRTVYRILNGEESGTDPLTGRVIAKPHVWKAVQQGRSLRNDMAAMQANAAGRRRLAYNLAPLAQRDVLDRIEMGGPVNLERSMRNTGRYGTVGQSGESGTSRIVDGLPTSAQRMKPTYRVTARDPRTYELPEELRDFAAPDDQGILGAENLRRNYLPGPHQAAEVEPNARPQPFNLLRPFAPNAIQRDEFRVGSTPEDLDALDEAFRGAIRNAARQGTAGRMRSELGVPLSLNAADREPTALEQLFDVKPRAKGEARTRGERIEDAVRAVVGIPKNTLTAFGLKHGLVNVPTLALLSEGPRAAAAGISGGVKQLFRDPFQQYEALREGIEGGVVTPFADRENALVSLLGRTPIAARAGVGAVGGGAAGAGAAQQHGQNPLVGGAIGALTGAALGAGAPALSRGANDLTWAIDDAAKQYVYKRKLARGMSPAQAAAQTSREMVDYRHASDFTKMLGLVAPFATFRSRLPAAVGSSVARNPQIAIAADRLTQGLAGSGNVGFTDPFGQHHKVTLTTPLSDAAALPSDPKVYARAALADPVKALLSAPAGIEKAVDPNMSNRDAKLLRYFTYGQPLLPHMGSDGAMKSGFISGRMAGYAPLSVGEAALDAANASDFGSQDWLSALLGAPLGVYVR